MHIVNMRVYLIIGLTVILAGILWYVGDRPAPSPAQPLGGEAGEEAGVVQGGGGVLPGTSAGGDGAPGEETAYPQTSSALAETTAIREYALKILALKQHGDFLNMHEELCPTDKRRVARTAYAVFMSSENANDLILDHSVQNIGKRGVQTEVSYVEIFASGKSRGGTLVLEKEGTPWCLRAADLQKILDITYFGNLTVAVTSITIPYEELVVPSSSESVRVDFEVKNTGDKMFACHDPVSVEVEACSWGNFRLRDALGSEYAPRMQNVAPFRLVAGGSVRGFLVYEIPVNTSGYTLVFKDFGYKRDVATTPSGL